MQLWRHRLRIMDVIITQYSSRKILILACNRVDDFWKIYYLPYQNQFHKIHWFIHSFIALLYSFLHYFKPKCWFKSWNSKRRVLLMYYLVYLEDLCIIVNCCFFSFVTYVRTACCKFCSVTYYNQLLICDENVNLAKIFVRSRRQFGKSVRLVYTIPWR